MEENKELPKEAAKKVDNQEEVVELEVEEEEKIIEISESEYNSLKDEILKQKKVAQDNLERLQRAQADFENYKKVLEKDKKEFVKYAEKNILLDLLYVIDEIEIVINAVKNENDATKVKEGLTIIYKKFLEFLEKEGVKPIKCIGNPFDPFLHEALLSEKTKECPEDTVLQEIKKGYLLKDKVLRPALVKIAKNE